MRRAARKDTLQESVVEGLRAAGFQVEIIERPVDLMYASNGRSGLLEVKKRGKETRKDQKAQQDFVRGWPGPVSYCDSAEEAIWIAADLCFHGSTQRERRPA